MLIRHFSAIFLSLTEKTNARYNIQNAREIRTSILMVNSDKFAEVERNGKNAITNDAIDIHKITYVRA
jgi:hypothetical protein